MNEQEMLEAMLNSPEDDGGGDNDSLFIGPEPQPAGALTNNRASTMKVSNISQWAVAGNGRFLPIGSTINKLEAGVYTPFATPSGYGISHLPIHSDGIYTLPDMATDQVLKEVQTFWDNEHLYRRHNLLYKRGILLFGPPGSGKTITVKLLMKELIKRDGIVILCQAVNLTTQVLKVFRDIEPKRNIIVVLEDIDEIIRFNGESEVLSLLDGEHNLDNVLNLATTNYPGRLGARIINRPSRFDTRVFVGMPSADARRAYLSSATQNGLSQTDLDRWTTDTEGMSIAHMRELVAAVYCLNQSYDSVIERLSAMGKRVVDDEDSGWNKKESLGFGARKNTRNND